MRPDTRNQGIATCRNRRDMVSAIGAAGIDLALAVTPIRAVRAPIKGKHLGGSLARFGGGEFRYRSTSAAASRVRMNRYLFHTGSWAYGSR